LIRLFAMMGAAATTTSTPAGNDGSVGAAVGTDGSGSSSFPGEIVLDPFCGTGTTCVAAKRMGLRWIGIDRVPKYADLARVSVGQATIDGGPDLRVGFLKWPTKVEEASEAEKVDVSDAAASHRTRPKPKPRVSKPADDAALNILARPKQYPLTVAERADLVRVVKGYTSPHDHDATRRGIEWMREQANSRG
jgi:hypothetical protein